MSRITEIEFMKEPQTIIDEIVGRFSVRDLREMSDKDLARGEDLLGKVKKPIEILAQGEANLIRWWQVRSNGREYHVKRFENFVFCSCFDFFFTKTCCRHITVSVKFYCKRCFRREVQFGKLCANCQADTAPYLKPSSNKPVERLGGITIS